jgi:hypothetical protein
MRFSRTYRAIVVFLFVGFLGASGPACNGSETLTPSDPPRFEARLEYSTRTFHVSSMDGLPGAPGLFNFLVLSGPVPGLIQVPFTYDASGCARACFSIAPLVNGLDCLVAMNCVSVGCDSEIHESGVWALTTRNYVVTDPENPPCSSCPTTPGGWIEDIEWPGASAGGPLYPHSLMAINTDAERVAGTPMLALESGPAGSFPIN